MNNDYKARIDRATRYIEDNLSTSISLNKIAQASHFSEYHFHRIFKAVLGETVNDYVVRRRLECAANLLIFNPSLPITSIALQSGYSSSANFSKAVKLYFGFSPSEIRNPKKVKDSKIGKIFSKYGKDFKPSDLYPHRITNTVTNNNDMEDINMKVTIKQLEGLRVCSLASTRGYETEGIFEAWDRISNWAASNGIRIEEQQRFALCYDNPTVTPILKCRYHACVVINESIQVKPPFTLDEIPQGKYAVHYFKGEPEQTLQAQLNLYSDWLPNSGFEPDNFPMMEHYLNDVRIDGYIEMEIYVKLKALEALPQ